MLSGECGEASDLDWKRKGQESIRALGGLEGGIVLKKPGPAHEVGDQRRSKGLEPDLSGAPIACLPQTPLRETRDRLFNLPSLGEKFLYPRRSLRGQGSLEYRFKAMPVDTSSAPALSHLFWVTVRALSPKATRGTFGAVEVEQPPTP